MTLSQTNICICDMLLGLMYATVGTTAVYVLLGG